ncbi:MAG TPA: 4-hydroxy-tetrahydrodipicolinate synthase [Nocardioides sp.]|uniref:4-hydroxy-tetrahydrodipicolinate synthase n=1 Tax=Nocardioides sp. TaxID=35761 RepID=UPI002E35F28D|nr:4-hydroxy-tetrahydrodipicolinate synthase [Nocardioides sp.]HEX3929079.1 4-hydroxy-tetrahydrodipicolinate synthase [Nocardioides sp.]
MTAPAPFGRMLTAMATAFTDEGAVDLDATAAIAVHLVEHGHDGVVVSGTTGESPTCSVAETGDILRVVKDAVGERARVVAGVGSNATAHSIELARQAEKLGADALLLVAPYYSKPGQAGVVHHFRQVAAATGTPVILYDVPGRTGTPISVETYERVKSDTVVAVKEAVGDFARGVRLQELGYAVYSGDDVSNLAWLAHGASGVISVVGHVAGHQLRSQIEDFLDGNTTAARKTYDRLMPATQAIMGVPNYGATTAKACLQLLGVLDNRNVRGPLVPLTDEEVAALRAGLEASHLL